MGKDAPDWQDTIYQIQEGGLSYPQSVWALEGVTQVIAETAVLQQTKVLYDVPEGKIFYLTSLWGGVANNTPNVVFLHIHFENEGHSEIYRLQMFAVGNTNIQRAHNFSPPVKFLPEWRITVESPYANVWGAAFCTGYTLPSS